MIEAYRSPRLEARLKREQARKEAERKEKARKVGGVLAVVLMLAGAVGVMIGEANAEARRVEEMKRQHADEMAECLTDWKAGKNGGCDWEVLEIVESGEVLAVGVEVIAKPAED